MEVMISRVAYLNQEINSLRADERDELWEMQRVVPMVIVTIAADVQLEIERRQQADRAMKVPEAARYLGVSAYVIRQWLDGGYLRNENPADGYVLMSVKQLNEFKERESNLVKKKQRKARAVPAGAKDFRKAANG
nr:excisionase [uncultured Capnocytophaga sp.]